MLRRFTGHRPALVGIRRLEDGHPALVEGRTLYRARVVPAAAVGRLLKSGVNSRKIGGRVMKGRWAGMPVYTLTLEERATCPRSCVQWADCYGNKMNWSQRLQGGAELERRLANELATLAEKHPGGFVVRLHVLGDFYSVGYVRRWLEWLEIFPMLRVFGYTAWQHGTPIGDLVAASARTMWPRFAVRTSGAGGQRGTVVVYRRPEGPVVDGAIVCPAQTGRSDCCATCALCWATERPIAFMAH